MAVKDTPVYAQKARTAFAICTVAKTTYSDITGAVLLATAGADGMVLRGLRARPRANVTATQLQLYLTKNGDTSNASPVLIDTVLGWSGGYTLSQVSQIPAADFGYSSAAPRKLEAGDKLFVAIGVALAGGIVFEAEVEDF